MRLLLVDDDDDVRLSLADALRLAGHVVVERSNGREAFAWLHESIATPGAVEGGGFPDAIVLDILMPRMNGQQFLVQLRADPQLEAVPVVVLSALVPMLFSGQGADAVLAKPVHVEELMRVLERVVGTRRAAAAAD